MSSFFSALLSYLLIYKYIALFAVVFFGAIAIPFPVDTILLAVGAFSNQGYMNFFLSVTIAVTGNVLGDLLVFALSRKYEHAVLRKLHIRPTSYFAQLEKYIYSHARLTIFLTRFVGFLGSITNFLAGIAKIPFQKFLLFDIAGNFVEIGAVVFFGYLVGNYWENFTEFISLFDGILILTVAIFFVVRFLLQQYKTSSAL